MDKTSPNKPTKQESDVINSYTVDINSLKLKKRRILDTISLKIIGKENKTITDMPETTKPARFASMVILLFFGIFGAWAVFAPMNAAVMAPGQITNTSKKQVVQHLEGGIIEDIYIRDGDRVTKGDGIIKIHDTGAKVHNNIINEQLMVLKVTEFRLLAERKGNDDVDFEVLSDNADFVETDSEQTKTVIQNQRKIFESRRSHIKGRIEILEYRINGLNEEIKGIEIQLQSVIKQINYTDDELKTVKKLLANGNVQKSRLLNLEKQKAELEGRKGHYQSAIAQAKQKIGEAQTEILNIRYAGTHEIEKELKEVESQIADITERKNASNDTLNRTNVTAPISGIVKGLRYYTKGGIVPPGSVIAEIVPTDKEIIIEAKILPKDIENLLNLQIDLLNYKYTPGIDKTADAIPLKIRLTAYSARKVPLLEGFLLSVSPDIYTDERTGAPYYMINATLAENALHKTSNVTLYQGMPAELVIATHARTFVSYLFNPIIQSFNHAFREN